ncbi:MAG: phytol kinase [Candidatus Eremiobacteraeota bacterium]|jgi:phytol kinase|nr:phytol kinase [Candidatus Eremiobacteraeota bacterium]
MMPALGITPLVAAATAAPVAALVFAGGLALLVGGIGMLARRFAWEAEAARKASHVAVGLAVLSLPWLFAAVAPVVVLALVACAGLLALRAVPVLRERFGGALHGIARRSIGEFAFVGGVALAFALAHDHTAAYAAAILTLAFGDAAAALVGRRFGRHPYAVGRARKSFEGSCAFFAVAALVCALVPGAAGIAAVAAFALVTTLAEAFAGDGFDNAAIPVAGLITLRLFTGA